MNKYATLGFNIFILGGIIALTFSLFLNYKKRNTLEEPKFKVGDCYIMSLENEFQVKNYKFKVLKVGKEEYWIDQAYENRFSADPSTGRAESIKSVNKGTPTDCSQEYVSTINK